MGASSSTENSVRSGTATRQSGRRTARKILAAARELLTVSGYASFSMRNVADKAGIRLANLQYYYPRRDDLIRALLAFTSELYSEAYIRITEQTASDSSDRLELILRYQLQDVFKAETRHFFVQLWALLDSVETADNHLLGELYAYDIEQLTGAIKWYDPTINLALARERATLIAATIEGLMVVTTGLPANSLRAKKLSTSAYDLALSIARGSSFNGHQTTDFSADCDTSL